MNKKVRIGFVGVGSISGIYLKNLTEVFREVEIIGVCDLIRERAQKAVDEYNIPKLYNDMYELFADPDVDIVLNITRPYEHFEVTKAALLAGKHVYSEKPLGATIEEGVELVRLAEEKGLMLGGAPDTYMGAAIQTSRKLIEDGYIGTPIGAHAHMICHGHEGWHPDPEFYYKHGGGPMMDMGPYYVTALINLLGGVKKIAGMTKASFPTRTIKSQPHYGEIVTVDVPTYVTGIMEFDSGAIGTIFTTFDVYHDDGCKIEIYGTEGTLQVPDPNGFGGEVRLLRPEIGQYREVPHCFKYSDNSRGLGLADMAKALRTGRDFRSNYKQTMHVLEILETFKLSSESGSFIELKSKYTPGKPMINHPLDGIFED